jgi:hypothetical protein
MLDKFAKENKESKHCSLDGSLGTEISIPHTS